MYFEEVAIGDACTNYTRIVIKYKIYYRSTYNVSLFLPKSKKFHCLKVFLELRHHLISHVSFRDSSQHIFL